jgi:hypothetical protein
MVVEWRVLHVKSRMTGQLGLAQSIFGGGERSLEIIEEGTFGGWQTFLQSFGVPTYLIFFGTSGNTE